uniref:Uncharacterized protein n=1 Tax=Arundo donax TaxID=35708 RepID=A0A0A9A197_ARUDO
MRRTSIDHATGSVVQLQLSTIHFGYFPCEPEIQVTSNSP